MHINSFISQILPLQWPWKIATVELRAPSKEIFIDLSLPSNADTVPCPGCGAVGCPIVGRNAQLRCIDGWFLNFKTLLQYEQLTIICSQCGEQHVVPLRLAALRPERSGPEVDFPPNHDVDQVLASAGIPETDRLAVYRVVDYAELQQKSANAIIKSKGYKSSLVKAAKELRNIARSANPYRSSERSHLSYSPQFWNTLGNAADMIDVARESVSEYQYRHSIGDGGGQLSNSLFHFVVASLLDIWMSRETQALYNSYDERQFRNFVRSVLRGLGREDLLGEKANAIMNKAIETHREKRAEESTVAKFERICTGSKFTGALSRTEIADTNYSLRELHNAYKVFCKQENVRPVTEEVFRTLLGIRLIRREGELYAPGDIIVTVEPL